MARAMRHPVTVGPGHWKINRISEPDHGRKLDGAGALPLTGGNRAVHVGGRIGQQARLGGLDRPTENAQPCAVRRPPSGNECFGFPVIG